MDMSVLLKGWIQCHQIKLDSQSKHTNALLKASSEWHWDNEYSNLTEYVQINHTFILTDDVTTTNQVQ